ncbi:hypothetical protein G8764_02655 [Pseudomaricurvus alcaniphilus]|uniref:hypothetical protein n=1 Tax=Pseudomaricurvus alcaniphilus TaxID=1166482 RepID=UPI00140A6A1C|nr:hypothetical protein [Pseudomaricurvus alcaniphilus]NHN36188.1 hypothetical protein [Pseudomaricurvus alcaniphilus]
METNSSQHLVLKPIMYELGTAVYLCQLFENNLLLLISLLSSNSDNIVTAESFESATFKYSEKTLGQIAKVFREKLSLPGNFEQFIREGVEARNDLTHGFVMRNHDKFLTVDGRERIISELRESQHLINDRLQSVQLILNKALQVFGGSLEELREKQEFHFEPEGENHTAKH